MANICSRHQGWDPDESPDCAACNCTIHEFFARRGINYAEMHQEAEDAGETVCTKCEFKYFLTTKMCPLCSHPYEGQGPTKSPD